MPERSFDRFKQAERELEQAQDSKRAGRCEWASFAQQASEKAVKALHLTRGQEARGRMISWRGLYATQNSKLCLKRQDVCNCTVVSLFSAVICLRGIGCHYGRQARLSENHLLRWRTHTAKLLSELPEEVKVPAGLPDKGSALDSSYIPPRFPDSAEASRDSGPQEWDFG